MMSPSDFLEIAAAARASALEEAANIAATIPEPDIPGGVVRYDFEVTRDKIAAAIRAAASPPPVKDPNREVE